MLLPENAAPILAHALKGLIGQPHPGNMAFLRCLPIEVIPLLTGDSRFVVDGWEIAAVGANPNSTSRTITADTAVEWREDKKKAVVLLVNTTEAGAGMDGIYSAAREIGETELLGSAQKLARGEVPSGCKEFTRKAILRARRLTQNHNLSPWQEFCYLCRAIHSPQACGGVLSELGLWPIAVDGKPDDTDLDRAARMVEKLLPLRGSLQGAEARVAALKLPGEQSELGVRLARFLREADRLPRLEALQQLDEQKSLWLNYLQPGIFTEQSIQEIIWVPWRGKSGKLAAWSGLKEEEERAVLRLNPDSDNPKTRARLEVHWQVEPETLGKGTVDYVVEVRAGQDVLAEKTVTHSGKSPQKCVFTQDDFGELDETARFEAQIFIRALSHEVDPCESEEDFLVFFGDPLDKASKNSAGQIFASLALAVIQVAPDRETWDRFMAEPQNGQLFQRDKKGYISCRGPRRAARVFSPPLFDRLAKEWASRQGQPGRWKLVVRMDGSEASAPEFIPSAVDDAVGERFARASRVYAEKLATSQGPLGILYGDAVWISDYVNAGLGWWEAVQADNVLVHTLEVVELGGVSLGAIVLPTHPLRVAWQQGFDLLAMWHRYELDDAPSQVAKLLASVSSTHLPAFLPGFAANETLVFADNLGFHATAMVRVDDPEPKSTVALLARLLGGEDVVAPTAGRGAADLLANEIERYLILHPETKRVHVQALRAGDGLTVAKAMGQALKKVENEIDLSFPEYGMGTGSVAQQPLAFSLDFYNAGIRPEWSGRFLSATAEKRRSGAGSVPEEDRWLLESVPRPGGVTLPRLQWARRREKQPTTAAHLALVFDVFPSRVEVRFLEDYSNKGILEVHGLSLSPVRVFSEDNNGPYWSVHIPPEFEGEKHPVARGLTERLLRAHTCILRAVVRQLGGNQSNWPVLITRVSPDLVYLFDDLHKLCDWVITADRNAGVEYFDSPHTLSGVYNAYLIDCVPERDDLGFLQLITSTACLEEVVGLFDIALGEMGLSSSPRNCRFLLDALKSVSGRLAMRLAGKGMVVQEMIALALVQGQCVKGSSEDPIWPSLTEGFFIPLDDVPELLRTGVRNQEEERRADLLYVSAPKRGGLRFFFIEIKFRRSLRTARTSDVNLAIEQQLEASCRRWNQLYGADCSSLERTIRRSYLARILRFYVGKAGRHHLSEDAYKRINREIERMLREGSSYTMPIVGEEEESRKGFVFCPEYSGDRPDRIFHSGNAEIWLFGPGAMPEPRNNRSEPMHVQSTSLSTTSSSESPPLDIPSAKTVDNSKNVIVGRASIDLGCAKPGGEPVHWSVSIQSNPHLLIVGLPGMGKTTCLIRLCQQMISQGITPIVFSYHQDIDEKLAAILPEGLTTVNYAGLGFNPMEVSGDGPLAYIDTIGMLRDIFSAIFPDLGDIQLGKLRDALKRSFQDRGWAPDCKGETPEFGDFFSILRAEQKQDKGLQTLLTRLTELDDYRFFEAGSGLPSLLNSSTPALVQIHTTQNEVLQRAFATFVFYNLYQTMFKRGPQSGITHAIIFDEAHRAAKLKLIPTMAKECRKYGISLILASQEMKDFDPSLYTAVASYLTLRLHETDAKLMAKMFASTDKVALFADRIKQMAKYQGYFYGEGLRTPVMVALGK